MTPYDSYTSSVLEYLEDLGESAFDNVTHDLARLFAIQKPRTELFFIATFCPAYITDDVPCGPLSGSPQVGPDRDVQERRFPMLDYVAHFWVTHTSEALVLAFLGHESRHNTAGYIDLLNQLATLINSKERITTWIEASWLFGRTLPISNRCRALPRTCWR
jgi:hypothetical protein